MAKNNVKTAFSLIECMIYLIVFIILAHILISFTTSMYTKHVLANNTNNSILQLYSASDKLVHDIHNALVDTIKVKGIDAISFYVSPSEQIRWYIKNNRLLRASRRYKRAQKKWCQAISVAARHVDGMEIYLTQKDDYVEAIIITLASAYLMHFYSLYISLSSKRI